MSAPRPVRTGLRDLLEALRQRWVSSSRQKLKIEVEQLATMDGALERIALAADEIMRSLAQLRQDFTAMHARVTALEQAQGLRS